MRLEAEAVATKVAPLTPREQVASREEHIDKVAFNLVWFLFWKPYLIYTCTILFLVLTVNSTKNLTKSPIIFVFNNIFSTKHTNLD